MSRLTSILQLFSQSPIVPLQNHMKIAYACVSQLLPFFQAVLENNWKEAQSFQQQIIAFENEADDLKKKWRLSLSKNLSLPISRSDLLELLQKQEQLANKAKDIAGLVFGRHMILPPEISGLFVVLVERCIEAAKQALKLIEELSRLLEAGFHKKNIKRMEDMISQLDDIERDTDKLQSEIRQIVFSLEKDMAPVNVIFLYKVIEWIGDLADRSHEVGGQLYLLLAR
jgi:predicted phosphate transport protein (TIGR00153 family)